MLAAAATVQPHPAAGHRPRRRHRGSQAAAALVVQQLVQRLPVENAAGRREQAAAGLARARARAASDVERPQPAIRALGLVERRTRM
jgi:hypothetical protein